jgi:putative ABC transport system substrate-binding protein
MRRREFIKLLGGVGLIQWPRSAAGQQNRPPVVGVLRPNPKINETFFEPFGRYMRAIGWEEGRNIRFLFLWAEGHNERMSALAGDLAGPEVALQAVIGASGHIPIVMFAINFDPIERGYVTSLAQPSGNITGVIVRPLDLARKQIDLLRQVFPDRNRLAVLYDMQTADQFTAADQGAKSLNLQVQALKVDPAYDFAGAIRSRGVRRSAVGIGTVEPFFHQA